MRTLPFALSLLLPACIVVQDDDGTDSGTLTTPEDCAGVVFEYEGGALTDEQRWSCTTRAFGDLRITGTLVLEPCARLELGPDSRVFVSGGGRLEAVGTEDCPVTISSASSTPRAGDWRTIQIEADADGGTRFEHTVIEFGGASDTPMVAGDGDFDLVDVTLRGAENTALELTRGSIVALERLTFEDIGGHPLELDIDDAPMVGEFTATNVGEPRIRLSGPADDDGTWPAAALPFEPTGSFSVRGNVAVSAGATVQFGPEARMIVEQGGTFDLLGTKDAPIVVESAADSPSPGDWRLINVKDDASVSTWSHATVRHGGSDDSGALYVQDASRMILDAVTFEDNQTCDVGGPDLKDLVATDSTFTACD